MFLKISSLRFFTILLFSISIFSQTKIVLLDSVTKKPLSNATIKSQKGIGFYTNKKGVFHVRKNKTKQITISYLGYFKKKVNICSIKDTVFLIPKTDVLDELIIKGKKKEKKIIRTKNYGNMLLRKKEEIVSCVIPSEKLIGYDINKVSFSFQKLTWTRRENILKTQTALIRVNVYDVLNNKPNNLLFTSKIIKINALYKDLLTVNLEDELLTFNKEGLAFGIEYIGNIDNTGNFCNTKRLHLRPRLSKNKSNYFKAITFLRNPSLHKIIVLNELMNSLLPKDMKRNYDRVLNIRFEVSK